MILDGVCMSSRICRQKTETIRVMTAEKMRQSQTLLATYLRRLS